MEKALYLLRHLLMALFSKDSVGCWGRAGVTCLDLPPGMAGAAPLPDKVLEMIV